MFDLSFHYEGAPGGLRAAADAHNKQSPTVALPEALVMLLEEEVDKAKGAKSVVVRASGYEPAPVEGEMQRTVRELSIHVCFSE